MCPNVRFPSCPPYDGMLRDYVAIPAKLAHKLPDNVSTKEGALIEPLAVGLSAAERGNVTLGDTVVILGAGCIGLVTLLACKARGAAKIIIADLYDTHLAVAKKLGASEVINAAEEDIVKSVMEKTDGQGARVVFECAGSSHTAALVPELLKICGTGVIVSNINEITPIRFIDLMYKEAELRTIYRYKNNFPVALRAVSSGNIKIDQIVSHEFDFNDVQSAFENALHNKKEVIKAVVRL